ncbi:MAG: hypothetical protein OEY67_00175 [Gammaproteobacteria bacterium]|nr:hypothetical protein [Gammaproteobacteria bacterium]
MFRRLYFLFPSAITAHDAVTTLTSAGISRHYIHALARKDNDISSLPQATQYQKRDLRARLARILWNSDLTLFVVALIGFALTIAWGFGFWSIVALAIMIATFLGGAFYAIRVPEVTLAEFQVALDHNEVLLMVDVPKKRVNEIERLIDHRHPDADDNGSSWVINALGI